MDLEIKTSLENVTELLKKAGFRITKIRQDRLLEGKLNRRIGRFHVLGEELDGKVHLDLHWDFYPHIGPVGVDYRRRPMTFYKLVEKHAINMNIDCKIVGGMNWGSRRKIPNIGIEIRGGSLIIMLYAFACIFLQFFTHSLRAIMLEPLYYGLKDSLASEELTPIGWVADCELSIIDATFCGIVTGILVASLTYILVDLGAKKGELGMTTLRRHLVGLAIFAFYLLAFSITAYLKDLHLLGFDMLFVTIIAGLLWLVSSSYILSFRKRKPFFDYGLELKYLEKDHEANKMAVTIGLSAMIAIFASHLYLLIDQYKTLPESISGSEHYLSSLLIGSTLYIAMYAGFFVGVIVQRLWINDKIVERIKDIDIEKKILETLVKKGKLSFNDIRKEFSAGNSSRYLARIISKLIEDNKIVKERSGNLCLYKLRG
ncbi:MAG: hypothetical protein JSV12_03940 [Candidatus Bathyarchaeota archaeon]|nr:MAG: hypothetical protein JSV12_03940 [Candidatus Bathyarchaeota archaeon]